MFVFVHETTTARDFFWRSNKLKTQDLFAVAGAMERSRDASRDARATQLSLPGIARMVLLPSSTLALPARHPLFRGFRSDFRMVPTRTVGCGRSRLCARRPRRPSCAEELETSMRAK